MNFKGYIEGYYSRRLPLDAFKNLKEPLTHYFYGPKEDKYLRANWRIIDKTLQRRDLPKRIKQVYSISPGLDFNFESKEDFSFLVKKIEYALSKVGFNQAAIFLDDIDITNFGGEFNNKKLGEQHAKLLNRIFDHFKFKKDFWFCPSIYNESLSQGNMRLGYLQGVKEILNPKITIFWTGKNVISEEISQKDLNKLTAYFSNPIAIWDNFYANDYCPNRLFLGPLTGRSFNNKRIKGHFINGTGMKETDRFLMNYLFNKKQKIHYIPKDLLPLFKTPFYKITKKELARLLNLSSMDLKLIFEQPATNLYLEWKPFIISALNDIQLLKLKKEKEVERFLDRRYSPLVKMKFNKSRR